MAYGNVASEALEVLLFEDLRYETHIEDGFDTGAISCGYACALLSPVLESEQSVEG